MSVFGASASTTLQLKRAEHVLRKHLEQLLEADGLSFEQWQVLVALLEQPGLRMTDLAEAAVLPAASLTRHVDRLTERALVVRRVDSSDKRRVVVALSNLGEVLATRLREAERTAAVELESVATFVH